MLIEMLSIFFQYVFLAHPCKWTTAWVYILQISSLARKTKLPNLERLWKSLSRSVNLMFHFERLVTPQKTWSFEVLRDQLNIHLQECFEYLERLGLSRSFDVTLESVYRVPQKTLSFEVFRDQTKRSQYHSITKSFDQVKQEDVWLGQTLL